MAVEWLLHTYMGYTHTSIDVPLYGWLAIEMQIDYVILKQCHSCKGGKSKCMLSPSELVH